MPSLSNPRYELSAQALAAGNTQRNAYEAGGFKYKPANAHKFFKRPDIRARIEELLAERHSNERKSTALAVQKAALTREWIIERLMWLAERSLRGKPLLNERGEPTGKFNGVPDGATATRALGLLGRELGMFFTRHEFFSPDDFSRVSTDQLEIEVTALANQLGFFRNTVSTTKS